MSSIEIIPYFSGKQKRNIIKGLNRKFQDLGNCIMIQSDIGEDELEAFQMIRDFKNGILN